jgi:lipoate-protein ligase B
MLHIVDSGVMAYRPAWDLQLKLHEQVLGGEFGAGALMLVEHLPVVTIGRRADAQNNLLASPKMLAARGVEVVETDRGGDITFHGPGQLVAYPIVPLNTYNFNLHSYMRFLEEAVIRTVGEFGVEAVRDPSPKPATGVWVRDPGAKSADGLAKICALGIKVRRWVTLHGIALNVSTDLSFFQLINPCGLSRPVTSMQRLLGERTPGMGEVKGAFVRSVEGLLAEIPRVGQQKTTSHPYS